MKLIDTLVHKFRATRCRFSNNYHSTYPHTEDEMLCLHCSARWRAVAHEPGSWLRISDRKLVKGVIQTP